MRRKDDEDDGRGERAYMNSGLICPIKREPAGEKRQAPIRESADGIR